MCGKIVANDDLQPWGDCSICRECMEENCPSFDEEENKEQTTEAYESMRQRVIGKKTIGLDSGINDLSFTSGDETDICYSFSVTLDDDDIITDVSRLSAEMLLCEGETSSSWRPYRIDPDDYESIIDYALKEYVDFEENEDDD